MLITIPLHLLESVLRHYRALADAYRYDGSNKAANAARVATAETAKVRRLIERQKDNGTAV